MEARLDHASFYKLAPRTREALIGMSKAAKDSGLEDSLIELVKIRASQINGCAFCLDMHARDAVRLGESHARLHVLAAWEESPAFTPRERAALAWTEALTLVAEGHVPDAVWEAVRPHFTDGELAQLTTMIVTINAWNRIAVAYRFQHPVEPAAAAAA